MPQRVKATAEEKLQIVEQYLSGKIGYGEAIRQANVDDRTFRKWVSRYKAEGAIGLGISTSRTWRSRLRSLGSPPE